MREGGPAMLKHRSGFFLALILFTSSLFVALSPSIVTAQEEEPEVYPEGDMHWDMPDENLVFLDGTNADEATLTRIRPISSTPTGTELIPYTAGSPVMVLTADSSPATDSVNLTLNISAFFHFTLNAPIITYCSQTNPLNPFGGKATTLYMRLLVDDKEIMVGVSNSEVLSTNDAASPHNLTIEEQEVEFVLAQHEVLSLEISVEHNCEGTQAQLNWGSFGSMSGLVIRGELIRPEPKASVDDLGFAHIEMVPISPWGSEEINKIGLMIFGPILPDEYDTKDRDLAIESFDSPMGERKVEGNRTAWTWVSSKPLSPGHHLAKFCIQTIDGNTLLECHFSGRYRFIVPEEETTIFTAILWMSISSLLLLIGWIGFALKDGILYPPQMIAAFVVMAMLLIPLQMQMPDLDNSIQTADDSPISDFSLLAFNNNSNGTSFSLSELLEGKDALVIGVFQPGSPNANDQKQEFANAIDLLGDDVAFVQLATGQSIQMIDVESHAGTINGSWPILIDESGGSVARQLPCGVSDGVVVIDNAKIVTWWRAGSASQSGIITAVEGIESGGQQSIPSIFAVLWCAGALLLIGLPRREWEAPEEALPPGSLWGGIVAGGLLGFAIINLPILLLTLVLGAGEKWYWIDLALALWLIEQAVFIAWKGKSLEVTAVNTIFCKLMSKSYVDWRSEEDISTDIQIGVWVGWLSWFTIPMLIPQGISASARSGMWGVFISIFWTLGLLLCVGIVVLIIRLVASWGGPISRAFGKHGQPEFTRVLGLLMAPMGLWMLINGILGLVTRGII
jgi:small neutral amino acid transporter SnatA (MarC family)